MEETISQLTQIVNLLTAVEKNSEEAKSALSGVSADFGAEAKRVNPTARLGSDFQERVTLAVFALEQFVDDVRNNAITPADRADTLRTIQSMVQAVTRDLKTAASSMSEVTDTRRITERPTESTAPSSRRSRFYKETESTDAPAERPVPLIYSERPSNFSIDNSLFRRVFGFSPSLRNSSKDYETFAALLKDYLTTVPEAEQPSLYKAVATADLTVLKNAIKETFKEAPDEKDVQEQISALLKQIASTMLSSIGYALEGGGMTAPQLVGGTASAVVKLTENVGNRLRKILRQAVVNTKRLTAAGRTLPPQGVNQVEQTLKVGLEDILSDDGRATVYLSTDTDHTDEVNSAITQRFSSTFRAIESFVQNLNPRRRYRQEAQGIDTKVGSQITGFQSSAVFPTQFLLSAEAATTQLRKIVQEQIEKKDVVTVSVGGKAVQLPRALAEQFAPAVQATKRASTYSGVLGGGITGKSFTSMFGGAGGVQQVSNLYAAELINNYVQNGDVSADPEEFVAQLFGESSKDTEITPAQLFIQRLLEDLERQSVKLEREAVQAASGESRALLNHRAREVKNQIAFVRKITSSETSPQERAYLVTGVQSGEGISIDTALATLYGSHVFTPFPAAAPEIVDYAAGLLQNLQEQGLAGRERPYETQSSAVYLENALAGYTSEDGRTADPIAKIKGLGIEGFERARERTAGGQPYAALEFFSDYFGLGVQRGSAGGSLPAAQIASAYLDESGNFDVTRAREAYATNPQMTLNNLQTLFYAMTDVGRRDLPLLGIVKSLSSVPAKEVPFLLEEIAKVAPGIAQVLNSSRAREGLAAASKKDSTVERMRGILQAISPMLQAAYTQYASGVLGVGSPEEARKILESDTVAPEFLQLSKTYKMLSAEELNNPNNTFVQGLTYLASGASAAEMAESPLDFMAAILGTQDQLAEVRRQQEQAPLTIEELAQQRYPVAQAAGEQLRQAVGVFPERRTAQKQKRLLELRNLQDQLAVLRVNGATQASITYLEDQIKRTKLAIDDEERPMAPIERLRAQLSRDDLSSQQRAQLGTELAIREEAFNKYRFSDVGLDEGFGTDDFLARMRRKIEYQDAESAIPAELQQLHNRAFYETDSKEKEKLAEQIFKRAETLTEEERGKYDKFLELEKERRIRAAQYAQESSVFYGRASEGFEAQGALSFDPQAEMRDSYAVDDFVEEVIKGTPLARMVRSVEVSDQTYRRSAFDLDTLLFGDTSYSAAEASKAAQKQLAELPKDSSTSWEVQSAKEDILKLEAEINAYETEINEIETQAKKKKDQVNKAADEEISPVNEKIQSLKTQIAAIENREGQDTETDYDKFNVSMDLQPLKLELGQAEINAKSIEHERQYALGEIQRQHYTGLLKHSKKLAEEKRDDTKRSVSYPVVGIDYYKLPNEWVARVEGTEPKDIATALSQSFTGKEIPPELESAQTELAQLQEQVEAKLQERKSIAASAAPVRLEKIRRELADLREAARAGTVPADADYHAKISYLMQLEKEAEQEDPQVVNTALKTIDQQIESLKAQAAKIPRQAGDALVSRVAAERLRTSLFRRRQYLYSQLNINPKDSLLGLYRQRKETSSPQAARLLTRLITSSPLYQQLRFDLDYDDEKMNALFDTLLLKQDMAEQEAVGPTEADREFTTQALASYLQRARESDYALPENFDEAENRRALQMLQAKKSRGDSLTMQEQADYSQYRKYERNAQIRKAHQLVTNQPSAEPLVDFLKILYASLPQDYNLTGDKPEMIAKDVRIRNLLASIAELTDPASFQALAMIMNPRTSGRALDRAIASLPAADRAIINEAIAVLQEETNPGLALATSEIGKGMQEAQITDAVQIAAAEVAADKRRSGTSAASTSGRTAATKQKQDELDKAIKKRRDEEDAARKERRDRKEAAIREYRDREDAEIKKRRDEEDAARKERRDEREAALREYRDKEEPALKSQRDKEDAEIKERRDEEDAARKEKRDERKAALKEYRDREDAARKEKSKMKALALEVQASGEDIQTTWANPHYFAEYLKRFYIGEEIPPEVESALAELDQLDKQYDAASKIVGEVHLFGGTLEDYQKAQASKEEMNRTVSQAQKIQKQVGDALVSRLAAEEQQDESDAEIKERRDKNDELNKKKQDELDAAIKSQRDKEDAALKEQRDSEDAARKERRDEPDAARKERRDNIDELDKKKQDELDNVIKKQRDREDAARKERRDKNDELTKKKQDELDNVIKKQRDREDAARKERRDTIDAGIAAVIDVVGFDLETTIPKPGETAQILEFASVGGGKTATGAFATEVQSTMGSKEGPALSAKEIQKARSRLQRSAESGKTIVGHNIKEFDLPILFGGAENVPTIVQNQAVDTLQMANELQLPGSRTLGSLATLFGLEYDPTRLHEAAYDTDLNVRLYHELVKAQQEQKSNADQFSKNMLKRFFAQSQLTDEQKKLLQPLVTARRGYATDKVKQTSANLAYMLAHARRLDALKTASISGKGELQLFDSENRPITDQNYIKSVLAMFGHTLDTEISPEELRRMQDEAAKVTSMFDPYRVDGSLDTVYNLFNSVAGSVVGKGPAGVGASRYTTEAFSYLRSLVGAADMSLDPAALRSLLSRWGSFSAHGDMDKVTTPAAAGAAVLASALTDATAPTITARPSTERKPAEVSGVDITKATLTGERGAAAERVLRADELIGIAEEKATQSSEELKRQEQAVNDASAYVARVQKIKDWMTRRYAKYPSRLISINAKVAHGEDNLRKAEQTLKEMETVVTAATAEKEAAFAEKSEAVSALELITTKKEAYEEEKLAVSEPSVASVSDTPESSVTVVESTLDDKAVAEMAGEITSTRTRKPRASGKESRKKHESAESVGSGSSGSGSGGGGGAVSATISGGAEFSGPVTITNLDARNLEVASIEKATINATNVNLSLHSGASLGSIEVKQILTKEAVSSKSRSPLTIENYHAGSVARQNIQSAPGAVFGGGGFGGGGGGGYYGKNPALLARENELSVLRNNFQERRGQFAGLDDAAAQQQLKQQTSDFIKESLRLIQSDVLQTDKYTAGTAAEAPRVALKSAIDEMIDPANEAAVAANFGSRLEAIAGLVKQYVDTLDTSTLPEDVAKAAKSEIDGLNRTVQSAREQGYYTLTAVSKDQTSIDNAARNKAREDEAAAREAARVDEADKRKRDIVANESRKNAMLTAKGVLGSARTAFDLAGGELNGQTFAVGRAELIKTTVDALRDTTELDALSTVVSGLASAEPDNVREFTAALNQLNQAADDANLTEAATAFAKLTKVAADLQERVTASTTLTDAEKQSAMSALTLFTSRASQTDYIKPTAGVIEATERKRMSVLEEQLQAAAGRPGFFGLRRDSTQRRLLKEYAQERFGQAGADIMYNDRSMRFQARTENGGRIDLIEASAEDLKRLQEDLGNAGAPIGLEELQKLQNVMSRTQQTRNQTPFADPLFFAASRIRDIQTLGMTAMSALSLPSTIAGIIDQAASPALNAVRSMTSLRGLSRDQGVFNKAVAAASEQQALFGGSLTSNIGNITSFIPLTNAYGVDISQVVNVARKLAAFDPAQGMEGASIAIKEFLSGNVASLSRRFEINRSALSKIDIGNATEMLDKLDEVLAQMGVTDQLINEAANSRAAQYDKMLGRLETMGIKVSEFAVGVATPLLESILGPSSVLGEMADTSTINLMRDEGLKFTGSKALSKLADVDMYAPDLSTFTRQVDKVLQEANDEIALAAASYQKTTGVTPLVSPYRLLENMKPEERVQFRNMAQANRLFKGMTTEQALMQASRDMGGDYASYQEFVNQRKLLPTNRMSYEQMIKSDRFTELKADAEKAMIDEVARGAGGAFRPGILTALASPSTFLVGSLIASGVESASRSGASLKRATIGKVTDLDTFRTTSGERVRLVGIDAPETGSKAAIKAMSKAVEVGLRENENITYEAGGFDKYGRTLAVVYNEQGQMINSELIARGIAGAMTDNQAVNSFASFVADQGIGVVNEAAAKAGLGGLPVISDEVKRAYYMQTYFGGIGGTAGSVGTAVGGGMLTNATIGALAGSKMFAGSAAASAAAGAGIVGTAGLAALGAGVAAGGYALITRAIDLNDVSVEKMRQLYKMQTEFEKNQRMQNKFDSVYLANAGFSGNRETLINNELKKTRGRFIPNTKISEALAASGLTQAAYDEASTAIEKLYNQQDEQGKSILGTVVLSPDGTEMVSLTEALTQSLAFAQDANLRDTAVGKESQRLIGVGNELIDNADIIQLAQKYGLGITPSELGLNNNQLEALGLLESPAVLGRDYREAAQAAQGVSTQLTATQMARFLTSEQIKTYSDAMRQRLLNDPTYQVQAKEYMDQQFDQELQRKQQRFNTFAEQTALNNAMGLFGSAGPLSASQVMNSQFMRTSFADEGAKSALNDAVEESIKTFNAVSKHNKSMAELMGPYVSTFQTTFANYVAGFSRAGSAANTLRDYMSNGDPLFALNEMRRISGLDWRSMISQQMFLPQASSSAQLAQIPYYEMRRAFQPIDPRVARGADRLAGMQLPYTSGPRGRLAYANMIASNASITSLMNPAELMNVYSMGIQAQTELAQRNFQHNTQMRDLAINHNRSLEDITRNAFRQLEGIHLNATRQMVQAVQQRELSKRQSLAQNYSQLGSANMAESDRRKIDQVAQAGKKFADQAEQSNPAAFLRFQGRYSSESTALLEKAFTAYDRLPITDLAGRDAAWAQVIKYRDQVVSEMTELMKTADPETRANLQAQAALLGRDPERGAQAQQFADQQVATMIQRAESEKALRLRREDLLRQQRYSGLEYQGLVQNMQAAQQSGDPLQIQQAARALSDFNIQQQRLSEEIQQINRELQNMIDVAPLWSDFWTQGYVNIEETTSTTMSGLINQYEDFNIGLKQQIEDALINLARQKDDLVRSFTDAATEIATQVPATMAKGVAAIMQYTNDMTAVEGLISRGRFDEANNLASAANNRLALSLYGSTETPEAKTLKAQLSVNAREVPTAFDAYSVDTPEGKALRVYTVSTTSPAKPPKDRPFPMPSGQGILQ
jgi:endonuclease YncB( thermonuclease family)/DNA polymerase III epsilon subunit-like protein